MHRNNLVATVNVHGKPLWEDSSKVFLPFGTEYTIKFKNLDHKRIAVITAVEIDGKNTLNGDYLLVYPNQEFHLQGTGKTFNQSEEKDYAFKFIERTAEIAGHRGTNWNDGKITVRYQFELLKKKSELDEVKEELDKAKKKIDDLESKKADKWPYTPWVQPNWPYKPFPDITWTGGSAGARPCGGTTTVSNSGGGEVWCARAGTSTMDSAIGEVASASSANFCSTDAIGTYTTNRISTNSIFTIPVASQQVQEVGITTKGNYVEQNFQQAEAPVCEAVYHYMEFQLVGGVDEPVFSRRKVQCDVCGHKVKAKHKFCPNCGTNIK